MKNYFLILVILSTMMLPWEMFAASEIQTNEFEHILRVNRSKENPVDLMRSSKAAAANDHGSHFFTLKTMLRVGPEPLSDFDKKQIRNEICASSEILRQNAALADEFMPGSLGAYLHNQSVVFLHPIGLAGERLDSVLTKLSSLTVAEREAAAQFFAVAMTYQLQIIHGANVIWNNAELRNFYVDREGYVHAFDFSEATKPVALQAAKDLEFKKFFVNILFSMFQLLFPNDDEAEIAFENFITLLAAQAVSGQNVTVTNWRNLDWKEADVIAALLVFRPIPGGFTPFSVQTFFNNETNRQYRPSNAGWLKAGTSLSRDELLGTPYQDPSLPAVPQAQGMFYAHDDVIALFTNPGGAGRLYPAPAGVGHHAHWSFCNNWTGE